MATAQQAYDVARQPGYQNRVAQLLADAAVDVMAEDGATAGHAERVAYATSVLNGGASIFDAALATMSDSNVKDGADPNAVDNGVTDAEIVTAISGIFSALAGYPANPAA